MTMLTFILYLIAIFFVFMFFLIIFKNIWDAAYDRGYRQAKLDKKITNDFKTRKELDPVNIHKIYMN